MSTGCTHQALCGRMQCQAKGTVCSHNYDVGNYRAHAQLAIKHSIPSRGLQSSSRLACLCKGGSSFQLCWHVRLWVGMFWIRWIHSACGSSQRHPFEAHNTRSQCCSSRAETSPMGPCSSSCQAGSRSMSGITDLPVSYGSVGRRLVPEPGKWKLVPAAKSHARATPCGHACHWFMGNPCPAGHGTEQTLGFAGCSSYIGHPHRNNFNRPAWHPYFQVDSRESTVEYL